jgi:hypothetical protein
MSVDGSWIKLSNLSFAWINLYPRISFPILRDPVTRMTDLLEHPPPVETKTNARSF